MVAPPQNKQHPRQAREKVQIGQGIGEIARWNLDINLGWSTNWFQGYPKTQHWNHPRFLGASPDFVYGILGGMSVILTPLMFWGLGVAIPKTAWHCQPGTASGSDNYARMQPGWVESEETTAGEHPFWGLRGWTCRQRRNVRNCYLDCKIWGNIPSSGIIIFNPAVNLKGPGDIFQLYQCVIRSVVQSFGIRIHPKLSLPSREQLAWYAKMVCRHSFWTITCFDCFCMFLHTFSSMWWYTQVVCKWHVVAMHAQLINMDFALSVPGSHRRLTLGKVGRHQPQPFQLISGECGVPSIARTHPRFTIFPGHGAGLPTWNDCGPGAAVVMVFNFHPVANWGHEGHGSRLSKRPCWGGPPGDRRVWGVQRPSDEAGSLPTWRSTWFCHHSQEIKCVHEDTGQKSRKAWWLVRRTGWFLDLIYVPTYTSIWPTPEGTREANELLKVMRKPMLGSKIGFTWLDPTMWCNPFSLHG